jgi:hypothetical protein
MVGRYLFLPAMSESQIPPSFKMSPSAAREADLRMLIHPWAEMAAAVRVETALNSPSPQEGTLGGLEGLVAAAAAVPEGHQGVLAVPVVLVEGAEAEGEATKGA